MAYVKIRGMPWAHTGPLQSFFSFICTFKFFNNLGNLLFTRSQPKWAQRAGFCHGFVTVIRPPTRSIGCVSRAPTLRLERLARESSRHEVTWTWVRGHGASAEQNRCDQLAHAAARNLGGCVGIGVHRAEVEDKLGGTRPDGNQGRGSVRPRFPTFRNRRSSFPMSGLPTVHAEHCATRVIRLPTCTSLRFQPGDSMG